MGTLLGPTKHAGDEVNSVLNPTALSFRYGIKPLYATVLLNAVLSSFPPKMNLRTELLIPSAPSTTSVSCVDPSKKCKRVRFGLVGESEMETRRLLKWHALRSTTPTSASRKAALREIWSGFTY